MKELLFFSEDSYYFSTTKYFFSFLLEYSLFIMLISGVHQSESVTYIHIPTFLDFFSNIGLYRVLSRVPSAIQQILTSYLFYIHSVYT